MPKGIPVATFSIGGAGATNAAIFAAQMLSMSDEDLKKRVSDFRDAQSKNIAPLE